MSENLSRESLRSSKRQRKRKRRESEFYSEDSAVEVDIDSGSDTEFRCGSSKKKRLRRSGSLTAKRQAFGSGWGTSAAADWPTRYGGGGGGGEKLLLRQWLQRQADDETIPGLSWLDKDKTQIRIPWKHGSRTGWTIEDCHVYRAWAVHTGKIACVKEPKKWKANFRCALNSLPDVQEVTHLSQKKGSDPYKVYQMLEEIPRKSLAKKTKQCSLETIEDESEESCPLSSPPITQCLHSSSGIDIKDETMKLEIKLPMEDSFWQRDVNLKIKQTQLETQHTQSLIPTVVEELAEELGGVRNQVLMTLQSAGSMNLDSFKYQPVSPAPSSSSSSSSSPLSCNSEESIIPNEIYLEETSLFPELFDIKSEPWFIYEGTGYSENMQFQISKLFEV